MQRRASVALVVTAVLALVSLYAGEGRLTGAGSGRGSGCTIVQGPAEGRVRPVIATCAWPVPASQVARLLRDWSRHHAYFSNLTESALIDERNGVAKVRQVHRATGITDREVVVEWHTERLRDGVRYSWRKSEDQSSLSPDRIEVEDSRGHWEVRGDEQRSEIRYEARYLPGGGMPLFFLRLFQASGMKAVLAELRDAVNRTLVAKKQAGDGASARSPRERGQSAAGAL